MKMTIKTREMLGLPHDEIALREQAENEMYATCDEAVRKLRAYFGALEDDQREPLNKIIDEAVATCNYYTLLYVIMIVEDDMVEFRRNLGALIKKNNIINDTRGEDKANEL